MKTPLPKVYEGKTVAERLTASLREAVTSGCFEPGEKLDQDLIGAQYDVSRTPVREAVRRLEAEGFIEIRPHHGAFITAASSEEVHNIFEIRGLLESEIARRVTPHIPDASLDQLESMIRRTETDSSWANPTSFYAGDIHFHSTLLEFVDNKILREVLESLNNRISRVRRFAQLQPGAHMLESLREHFDILQAMRKRDPEDAARRMTVHLRNSELRIQDMVHAMASAKSDESVRAPEGFLEPAFHTDRTSIWPREGETINGGNK